MRALSHEIREQSRVSKEEWREYTRTVWQIANVTDVVHPAVFPIEIPTRLIKLFSFCHDIVLDPFAGVGTTAKAALALKRNAVCVEQNPRYASKMRRLRKSVANGDFSLTVKCGDSRNLHFLDDGSVGLVVTSPPYWNKADYGEKRSNIGKIDSYPEFLGCVRDVFKECYRVLAPGRKICIVTANVNQHTNHGLLTFPLAADFINALRDVGFVMVTEIIWSKNGTGGKWGSWGCQRPIFGSYPYPPNFLFKNIHEHILIFAKPNGGKTRGPKVRMLDEIMGNGNSLLQ
jgi:DNA modification methylase